MLRHRLLMIGIIVLAMGIQFRRVESYSLNEHVSGVIRDRMAQVREPMANPSDPFASWSTASSAMGGKMSLSPPRWLGFSMVSVGAVMILTSPCFKS